MPRVTLLLLVGAVFAPGVLGIVPTEVADWFAFVAHLALGFIGFLLGEELRWSDTRSRGRTVLSLSIGETLAAAAVAFAAIALLRRDLVLGLILTGIASMTGVSCLLVAIILGAVLVNRGRAGFASKRSTTSASRCWRCSSSSPGSSSIFTSFRRSV